MVAIFHAKRVALAHLYLVRGKYACRGVGMVIYADTARTVMKKAASMGVLTATKEMSSLSLSRF